MNWGGSTTANPMCLSSCLQVIVGTLLWPQIFTPQTLGQQLNEIRGTAAVPATSAWWSSDEMRRRHHKLLLLRQQVMKVAGARGGRRGMHSQFLTLITGCFRRVAVHSNGDDGLYWWHTFSVQISLVSTICYKWCGQILYLKFETRFPVLSITPVGNLSTSENIMHTSRITEKSHRSSTISSQKYTSEMVQTSLYWLWTKRIWTFKVTRLDNKTPFRRTKHEWIIHLWLD